MTSFPIIIRPEHLEICEGDHCAAAILDLFQRWTKGKQRKGSTPWIYDKPQDDLMDDLLGLFSRNRISQALAKLRKWGYLITRHNPFQPYDRTLQYQVVEVVIQEALQLLGLGLSIVSDETVHRPVQDDASSQLVQSSFYTMNQQTLNHNESTPTAPAYAAMHVGDVAQFTIPTGELPDIQKPSREVGEAQDEREAYTFQGIGSNANAAMPLSPVPPPPSPPEVDTTPDEPAPTWMDRAGMVKDAEIERWLVNDRERLQSWCEYAANNGMGGGFVRNQMRGKQWPPKSNKQSGDGWNHLTAEKLAEIEAENERQYQDFMARRAGVEV